MKNDKLKELRIDPDQKQRPKRSLWAIFLLVGVLTVAAIYLAIPREGDDVRVFGGGASATAKAKTNRPAASETQSEGSASTPAGGKTSEQSAAPGEVILTVSGYVIPRERIELSPRFMGTVKWIGVKKGDSVTNGQVVVLLDDSEYQARLMETQGRLAAARASLEKAQLQYERVKELASASIESRQMEDDMRLNVEAARALVTEMQGGERTDRNLYQLVRYSLTDRWGGAREAGGSK